MKPFSNHARLKIKRANSHIDSLIRDSSPLSKDLYEVTNRPDRSIAVLARLGTQSAHQIMTAAKATEDAKLRESLS